MDRKRVNFIKEQYPPGTRIRLNSMEDPYAPIAPGTEGVVDFVDDIGTIHMKWDNSRSLGIVPGEDSFSVLPPKLTTLKLYMPLTAELYERSVYGDLEPESTELDGRALRSYQNQIMAELVKSRMPEETERGLMHWYDKADSVNTKVHSAVFTVEERDRQLWGVAECRVAGELSAAELDTLADSVIESGKRAARIMEWANIFDVCSAETQKMIAGYVLKCVTVYRDYRVDTPTIIIPLFGRDCKDVAGAIFYRIVGKSR